MARKKRRLPEQFQAPVSEADKKKVIYKDDFQQTVCKKVEKIGKRFEGKGRNILYAVAAVGVLAVLIGIFYAWNRRATIAAETALGFLVGIPFVSPSVTAAITGSAAKNACMWFRPESDRKRAPVAWAKRFASSWAGSSVPA